MNKAEIISKENKVKVIIDGIEIKEIQSFKFQRDINNPKTVLEVKFICDLDTKEAI